MCARPCHAHVSHDHVYNDVTSTNCSYGPDEVSNYVIETPGFIVLLSAYVVLLAASNKEIFDSADHFRTRMGLQEYLLISGGVRYVLMDLRNECRYCLQAASVEALTLAWV